MAENESFFRKVVKFVANPSTDWTEINSRQEEARELEVEKVELKNMIERKRRNDFVRKREFDMLRRVRREGLTPEQLAALGGSSRLDDSDNRSPESAAPRPSGVKAKIDEIEQQMVGDHGFGASSRGRGPGAVGGAPAPQPRAGQPLSHPVPQPGSQPARPQAPPPPAASRATPAPRPVPAATAGSTDPTLARPSAPSPLQMAGGLPPLTPVTTAAASFETVGSAPSPAPVTRDARPTSRSFHETELGDVVSPFAMEVNEVVHDPELDEAVIAFANADFTQCEEALQRITRHDGPRAQHAETWLVLFDLYRATGQHQHFETLAVEYAQQFGWSAPQWYSLPRLVADALADEPAKPAGTRPSGLDGAVGWVCPELLDIESVARLRSQTLQMPLPWVFDWSGLRNVDPEAAMQLSMVFRLWAGQALDMRWIGGEQLFQVLQDAAPSGARDADPAYWLTRLDGLRLANRADQFDETAIDYCVTYEVSPPSWEPTRCKIHIGSSGLSTRTPPMSMVSDVSTSFLESHLGDEGAGVEVAHVELSGQLVGDIGDILTKLQSGLTAAPVISVSCARLIRVDFIAAGDLLNWVLGKRSEHRAVHFTDAHRLVALFFGAMGINEHAKVQVRKV